jgi:glycosyltransferase involved in cell wall biosynthesis
MRVLHLVSSTDRRGAQVFATQLAARLGGPPDHVVLAVEPGTAGGGLPLPVLGRRRSDVAGVARLVGHLRRADVLVAHGSTALLHGAVAGALARRPFVYRNIGDPSSWGRVRAADLRIGAPLRRAAAVSAIYPDARRHLVDAYRLDPARVVWIPNGVPDPGPPGPGRRGEARRSLGLDPARRWIGFVGALSAEKGVLQAIDAVALDPDLALVVAGDGPQRDEAGRAAAELAPGRVRFLGSVPDVGPVYAAVEAVVLPSRTEGIPAVAVEAGLRGLPVVATAVGGTPEVVVDGATGRLVQTAAPQVLRGALDEALAHGAEWGRAARNRCAERFTIDRVARQWAELLERVSTGRTAGG